MPCALGVTDLRWHSQMLRERPIGEVNFWTPTPWKTRLSPAMRFGFLLKAPIRKIGGFGHFVEYTELTVSEAWQRWGPSNGVESRDELYSRVVEFAGKRSLSPIVSTEPLIGCIALEDCVFLDAEDQVSPKELGLVFPTQVVKWKGFVEDLRLSFEPEDFQALRDFVVGGPTSDDRVWTSKRKRVSQPLFRRDVLAAYDGKCALTAADCAEVLEAAHIEPFRGPASNHPQNGIALRRDIHRLFDAGLLTFGDAGDAQISERIRGTMYGSLQGMRAKWPSAPGDRPSLDALAFHRTSVFRS